MAKVQEIRPPVGHYSAERTSKIDRLGELERRIALMDSELAEYKLLKEDILGWFKDHPANEGAIARGLAYEVRLGAKRNERSITDKRAAFNALKKSLGLDGVIAVIEIPLGAAIDKHIPKSAQKFITEERSGYRTLDVVALHPATKEQQAA